MVLWALLLPLGVPQGPPLTGDSPIGPPSPARAPGFVPWLAGLGSAGSARLRFGWLFLRLSAEFRLRLDLASFWFGFDLDLA